MAFENHHLAQPPTIDQIERMHGVAVLEFGTPWCGHCLRAQPLIEQALTARTDVQHFKVEDGKGKPLGRNYGVKLWPTLVFLHDGKEVARVVRPADGAALGQAFAALPVQD